jgi:hypothetical protein
MMVKGVCEASRSFQHLDPYLAARQLDLVWAAIATDGGQRGLRGRIPSVEMLDRDPPGDTSAPEAITAEAKSLTA